jgi:uncharacterized protein YlxW (UPF0749 family)
MAAEDRRMQPPPHAVMGLLNYITATALDEDYAVVSERHALQDKPKQGHNGLFGLVAVLVFGILVATAAVQTARNAAQTASGHDSLVAQINERKAALATLQGQIRDLHVRVRNLQAQYLQSSAEGRSLQARVQQLGMVTGSMPVQGPGVRITVDDAPGGGQGQQVLDKDLQKLVNGLWQVGAEAISINGQRLSNLTAIRRASEGITVNYRHINRPYVVSAIGNPDQMGARFLDTPGGQTWLALKSALGLPFDITREDSMKLPAAPRLTLRHAQTPGEHR